MDMSAYAAELHTRDGQYDMFPLAGEAMSRVDIHNNDPAATGGVIDKSSSVLTTC
jgi:hypothetical protein